MRKVALSRAARADLDALHSHVASDSPDRADSFVAEIRAKLKSLSERALIYPVRPELGEGVRSARHGAYLILYRAGDEQVRVLRVVHGARDVAAVMRREPPR